MKVEYNYSPGVFTMTFYPEEGEGVDVTQKVTMGNKVCTTYLPKDLNIKLIHPDVLGLITLLIVYPFTKIQLSLPMGVSQAFHDEVKKVAQISVLPVNEKLKPRKAPVHSRPALAYSGGIDSTACLMIMPANTCAVFHERTLLKGERFNQFAAIHACKSLKKLGRSISMIKSDFDYVRQPKGFAVELSTTIPALFLSEHKGFDSVALGTTLEYFIDHSRYYERRTYSVKWDNLFHAVDIQLTQPTAGISEVGNYKIVLNSPYAKFAEACMFGSVGKPCMNCVKCFSKQLVKMTLQKKPVSNELLDRLFKIRKAQAKLEKFPVFFENVITYITANYRGNHGLMILLKRKTRGNSTDVSWMEKWYSPNRKYIPLKYRSEMKRNIVKHLAVMTVEDETKMKKWERDFTEVLSSPVIKKHHSRFVHAIRSLNDK